MPVVPATPTSALTPIRRRRRTRPSFSPIKNIPEAYPKRRNSTGSEAPATPYDEDQALVTIPTAPLEFAGFSFVGSDGSIHIRNVSKDDRAALSLYLAEKYDIDSIVYFEPFIILEFADEDAIPAEGERPFSIAGMIAIYNRVFEVFDPYVGQEGLAGDVEMDATIVKSF